MRGMKLRRLIPNPSMPARNFIANALQVSSVIVHQPRQSLWASPTPLCFDPLDARHPWMAFSPPNFPRGNEHLCLSALSLILPGEAVKHRGLPLTAPCLAQWRQGEAMRPGRPSIDVVEEQITRSLYHACSWQISVTLLRSSRQVEQFLPSWVLILRQNPLQRKDASIQ